MYKNRQYKIGHHKCFLFGQLHIFLKLRNLEIENQFFQNIFLIGPWKFYFILFSYYYFFIFQNILTY